MCWFAPKPWGRADGRTDGVQAVMSKSTTIRVYVSAWFHHAAFATCCASCVNEAWEVPSLDPSPFCPNWFVFSFVFSDFPDAELGAD